MDKKIFKEKFKIKELALFESKYWVVGLKHQQPTLGSFVLSVKRDCSVLSELSKHETEELSAVFELIEVTLKKAFNYDKINYLALMTVDSYVHFTIYQDIQYQGYSTMLNYSTPICIMN